MSIVVRGHVALPTRPRRGSTASGRPNAGHPVLAPGSGGQAARERDGRRGADAVTLLSVYLVLLLVVPSSLTITALGSLGHPAMLWALGALLYWCWFHINRHVPVVARSQPVRIAALLLVAAALASYVWAMMRGLPATEISVADSGLIRLLSLVGVLLIAVDGIDDRERLHTLLRRIVFAGGAMAALGLAQFATGHSFIDTISIPGMSIDSSGVDTRGGFVRASGTASHPLEYGVVLCIALPLAISLALTDVRRSKLRRWSPVALIALASVLSVSRSALIGLLAGVLILFPGWSKRMRWGFAGAAAAGIVAIGVLVPGMLGTIRGLFAGASEDSSTLSRLSSYDIAGEFISHFPIVGKGFGTLLPIYHIFDNQFLLMTVELGLVGLAAFLGLFVCAVLSALRARSLAQTERDRQLSLALVASTVAGGLLMAFFDGLSFPMSAGLVFLMLGVTGAARRLALEPLPRGRRIMR
jgi:hypothetical protein